MHFNVLLVTCPIDTVCKSKNNKKSQAESFIEKISMQEIEFDNDLTVWLWRKEESEKKNDTETGHDRDTRPCT